MNYDDDLLLRLADVNPAPEDAALPLASSSVAALAAVTERIGTTEPVQGIAWVGVPRFRRGFAIAAAAFALVLAIGAVTLLINPADQFDPATAPTTTPVVTVTTTPLTTTSSSTTTTSSSTTTTSTTTTSTTLPPPFAPVDVDFSFTIAVGEDSVGVFQASGTATDADVMCTSGTSYETGFVDLNGGHEQWVTHLRCDDDTGRFKLECDSRGAYEGTDWVASDTCTAAGSTGAYVGISGEVSGTTVCSNEGVCVVEYAGTIERTE